MHQVELTWYEILFAATVGIRRNVAAMSKRLPDRYGFNSETGWQVHIEGACGEMAFAKCSGLYWSASINTFKNGGDVGNIQVRTRSRADYDLIVRPDERDDDKFVLVTGTAPSYQVVGWIRGGDAKRETWKQTYGNRPPAFFVPKHELRPIEEINT